MINYLGLGFTLDTDFWRCWTYSACWHFLLMCFCLFWYIILCVHIHVCARKYCFTCGGQRSTLGTFIWSLCLFFETGSINELGARCIGQAGCQQAPEICLSPPLLLGWQVWHHPWLLHGCWGSEHRSSCLHRRHFTQWMIKHSGPCLLFTWKKKKSHLVFDASSASSWFVLMYKGWYLEELLSILCSTKQMSFQPLPLSWRTPITWNTWSHA